MFIFISKSLLCSPRQPNLYLGTLTPLRGIAAILVTLFHFQVLGVRFIPDAATYFISHCYLMVDLFFVMSGFIIKHVYENSFITGLSGRSYGGYLGARFSRIYPLHFFMLVILVIFFYAANGHSNPVNNPAAIPTHLFLLHSFYIHPVFTWNVPSWSISAEWFSYLLFPFLIVLENRWKKGFAAGSIIFILTAYLSIMFLLHRVNIFVPQMPVPHDLNVTYDYGFLRGLAGFLTGMLVYEWYRHPGSRNLARRDLSAAGIAILLIILLHFHTPDILIIPGFAILVLCCAANEGSLKKAFSRRIPQYIGNISYSIYLAHILGLILLGYVMGAMGVVMPEFPNNAWPFWKGLLLYGLFLAIVLLLSSLTYYSIEKPCRILLNKLFKHRENAPQAIA
jgi:peptidoglycan/LPS O-acetylase OafA/YrhL